MTAPLTLIGRYQIITRLAVGGMAEVYLARHGQLSGFRTLVVVKKVLPHLACNPDFIAMFLDEARIASLLDHPNVVRIYEVGREGNEYFLAMELVQGKPLSSIMRRAAERREPIDARIAALIIAQAAGGLHHAHELSDSDGHPLGLVHRDVSPQNLLISFEGSVKVIDFGIARALGRLTDTNSGSMKGKVGYMSPEQARGEEVDRRTDVFSLGVILWEWMAGRRLFTRDSDFGTMRALVYESIPRLSSVATVAPELDALVMKALSRNAHGRFQTAHDLAVALEQFVYRAGGCSAGAIATLMKTYFEEDRLKWKNTARVALDMEVPEAVAGMLVPHIQPSRTGVSGRSGAAMPSRPMVAASNPSVTAPIVMPPRDRWRWLSGLVRALPDIGVGHLKRLGRNGTIAAVGALGLLAFLVGAVVFRAVTRNRAATAVGAKPTVPAVLPSPQVPSPMVVPLPGRPPLPPVQPAVDSTIRAETPAIDSSARAEIRVPAGDRAARKRSPGSNSPSREAPGGDEAPIRRSPIPVDRRPNPF